MIDTYKVVWFVILFVLAVLGVGCLLYGQRQVHAEHERAAKAHDCSSWTMHDDVRCAGAFVTPR